MEQGMTEKPRKKRNWTLSIVLLLAIFVVLASILTVPPFPPMSAALRRAKLANEFNQVQTAVLGYYTEYTEYPVAPDNATLIQMLNGMSAKGNTRQIAFVTFRQSDLDEKSELLDPWGTPIQLSVDADGHLLMRSAGPDKTFGTADDIVGK